MKHLLVRQFFASARHPTFGVPYTQVYYQPMHELLDYLRALRSCGQSTHPNARQELRPSPAAVPHSTQSGQGRLAPVRPQLLPAPLKVVLAPQMEVYAA